MTSSIFFLFSLPTASLPCHECIHTPSGSAAPSQTFLCMCAESSISVLSCLPYLSLSLLLKVLPFREKPFLYPIFPSSDSLVSFSSQTLEKSPLATYMPLSSPKLGLTPFFRILLLSSRPGVIRSTPCQSLSYLFSPRLHNPTCFFLLAPSFSTSCHLCLPLCSLLLSFCHAILLPCLLPFRKVVFDSRLPPPRLSVLIPGVTACICISHLKFLTAGSLLNFCHPWTFFMC